MLVKRILAVLAVAVMPLGGLRAQEVTVFAAASLTNAVTEVAEAYAAKGLGKVKASYASSSTLAKQIENGAPAHLFIAADRDWMDYLAARGRIDADSRVDILGNALVLIAPAESALGPVRLAPATSLAKLAGEGRIATGDPDHVPAGKYARQAFEALGQWTEIAPKLARADSVRAALALVERGEVPLGVVYATDAAASKTVKVIATFPGTLHAPIVYPAALVAGPDNRTARAFLAFIAGAEAKRVFARHGFTVN